MSLITVDASKCKQDGICVEVCPVKILEIKPDGTVPSVIFGSDDRCIRCGHCVAVCPHGALSHQDIPMDQCHPVRRNMEIGQEQAEYFLRSRRSIRTYKQTPVDKETLEKLINTARFAPSGRNCQPVKWLVIHDSREVSRFAGMVIDWMRYVQKESPTVAQSFYLSFVIDGWESGVDLICRNAPHLVIAYGDVTNSMAQSSCTIALTYLDLAAPSYGLGTCWAGFFHAAATLWPPLQKALALPENHVCYGAMMTGYPKYAYHRLPARNQADISWK